MIVDEQISELTRMGSGSIMTLARPGAVMLVAGFVLAWAFTGNLVFYGIALAFAFIAVAIWQTIPHISNAARGLREGLKQSGSIEISIHRWTDAESNHHESYQGIISMNNQPLWQMEFVTPQNWQPTEGKYSAQLAFIRGVDWPVVILVGEGLLYPRLTPRRVSGSQRWFL